MTEHKLKIFKNLSRRVMRSHFDIFIAVELWLWQLVVVLSGSNALFGFDVFRAFICHLPNSRTSGDSNAKEAATSINSLLLMSMAIRIISLLKSQHPK